MTHQAIDIFGIAEIKTVIGPAIAGVAGSAGRPVGCNTNAKIIDGIFFTEHHRFGVTHYGDRLAFPGPVRCFHDLYSGMLVAFQAAPGDGGTVGKLSFDQIRMIGVDWTLGQVISGVGLFDRAWNEQKDGDNEKQGY